MAYNQNLQISKSSNLSKEALHAGHTEKLEEVRHMIRRETNSLESLVTIDSVQRLGIVHHFYEEIEEVLSRHYRNLEDGGGAKGCLFDVALSFRLLRQNGYYISTDLFNNFKDEEGSFKLQLSKDIQGMLGLYEASYMGIEGEEILDEAKEFARKHLTAWMTTLSDWRITEQIGDAFETPFHMSLPRYKIKHYLKNSSRADERTRLLHEVAKFDFNVVQDLHQSELREISKWDIDNIERLPKYMKVCFVALHNITNEIANKVLSRHGWNPIDSLKKAWATLCNAFLVEAKWFASGYVPKAEEYLSNGAISSGVHVVLVHVFFPLGHGITSDTVDRVDNMPPIVWNTAGILRLWDDLGSAKDENQEGFDGSYVDCYMKEHQRSRTTAREHVMGLISNSWKRLNEEFVTPNPFSISFAKASLNMARMVQVMYSYDDDQRLPTLEEHINVLLKESIPL